MSTQKNDPEDLHSLQPSSGKRDEAPKLKAAFAHVFPLERRSKEKNALGFRAKERKILI